MHAGLALDFQNYMTDRRAFIEEGLRAYFASNDPPELWEAMRYSVLSGGKRIRALLCLAAAEAVAYSGDKNLEQRLEAARNLVLPCAAAIEMIHAMSLIHDDLPCMDNDDLRRGQPTNHKVFGEAMALLAGDALLVLANEILLKESSEQIDPRCLIAVSKELSMATGAKGMVGGQVADMAATGLLFDSANINQNAQILSIIHERKTGSLLRFSVWSGACLMGAQEQILSSFKQYGEILGLSFQVADDLLDVTGNVESLGKTPGKDQSSGKLTWVSLYGIDEARHKLSELEKEGKAALDKSGLAPESLKPLQSLLEFAIHRKN